MENSINKKSEKKESESTYLKYEGMALDELRNALMKEYDSCNTLYDRYSKEYGLFCHEARLLMVEGLLIDFDDVTRVYISEETDYSGRNCDSTYKFDTSATPGKIEYEETTGGPAYDYDDISYWGYVSINYTKNGKEENWNKSFEEVCNEFRELAKYVAHRACDDSQGVEIIRISDGVEKSRERVTK